MNAQLKPTRRGFWAVTGSSGVGPTSVEIARKYREIGSAANDTSQGLERLEALRRLVEAFREASGANWDGYSAAAVQPFTLHWAKELLQSLPEHVPIPEVMANPDGDLSFEWYRDPHHNLVVAVDERGILHYAGLFGVKSTYGTDHFAGDVPDEILRQIHRHLANTE